MDEKGVGAQPTMSRPSPPFSEKSRLIFSASHSLGVTNLPKNYNPVTTILVYSVLSLVSEIFLCKFVLFEQNLESTSSKASGIQGDAE